MRKTVFEVVQDYLSEREKSDNVKFALKLVVDERNRGYITKTAAIEMQHQILSAYVGIPLKEIFTNKWECWTLLEDDIKEIATEYSLSLEGKDMNEIAIRAKELWALDAAWVKYVKEAIQEAKVEQKVKE